VVEDTQVAAEFRAGIAGARYHDLSENARAPQMLIYPETHPARAEGVACGSAGTVAVIWLRLAEIVPTDIVVDYGSDAQSRCREW